MRLFRVCFRRCACSWAFSKQPYGVSTTNCHHFSSWLKWFHSKCSLQADQHMHTMRLITVFEKSLLPLKRVKLEIGNWNLEIGIWNLEFGIWICNLTLLPTQISCSPDFGINIQTFVNCPFRAFRCCQTLTSQVFWVSSIFNFQLNTDNGPSKRSYLLPSRVPPKCLAHAHFRNCPETAVFPN
jgi:hypothetical protein